MGKNEDLILLALDRIRPDWVSNSQLESRAGVRPHAQVFQITQRLRKSGLIEGEQRGKEWFFRSPPQSQRPTQTVVPEEPSQQPELGSSVDSYSFELRARAILSFRLGTSLMARSLPNVPKNFDLVSMDGSVVGDAKYFDLVRGKDTPPAKFSIIAEYVWLLEKIDARCRFLVFGNNRLVPTLWLKKYGHLVSCVAFLFLDEADELEVLSDYDGAFSNYRA